MKQLKYLIVISVGWWLFPTCVSGQIKSEKNRQFEIYVFPGYYSQSTKDYLLQNNCPTASLLTPGVIDPDKDQQVNSESVKKYVAKLYPDVNATNLFVIDWESQPFSDLRQYDKDDERFRVAEAQYIQLIKTIKALRPQLRVGIYGIPFRFLSDWQKRQSADNELDNLLSYCDVLTPSLYIVRTDEEIGEKGNMNYLKQNLDQALNYGARLKKPVLPFFWYRIHPANKRFGMNIIAKDKMEKYLAFLSSYSSRGNKINGILWWEGSDISKNKGNANRQVQAFSNKSTSAQEIRKVNRDSIVINYLAPFLKKKEDK